jgi:hypothetical protein
MRSPKLDLKYWNDLCEEVFDKKVTKMRQEYQMRFNNKRSGKVLYVNSISNPWAETGVFPTKIPKGLSFIESPTQVEDKSDSEAFTYTCDGHELCQALDDQEPNKTDSKDLTSARKRVVEWVEDFI